MLKTDEELTNLFKSHVEFFKNGMGLPIEKQVYLIHQIFSGMELNRIQQYLKSQKN